MISADLLELLCCPATRLPLSLANGDMLARINSRRDERVAVEPLDAALVRSDGVVAYPVRGGIPVLLADEAISL